MAAIDYATCGISDVIAQSLKLHSPLLSDHLRAYARVLAQFADAYDNREVMRNELAGLDLDGVKTAFLLPVAALPARSWSACRPVPYRP